MMASPISSPMSIRIAQAIGLTSAAWLSGNIAALSLIAVPSLTPPPPPINVIAPSIAPTTLARQWHGLYSAGKAQNPPVAVASASAFLYLAYAARVPRIRNLYGLAAALTVAIVPWTILTMGNVNGMLTAKATGTKEAMFGQASFENIEVLLKRWSNLNGVRSLFPLAGAVVGVLAVLG